MVVADTARRRLRVFDATCPLVTKVHLEVGRYAQDGRDVILVGHAGHPEVVGTMGRFDASQGGRIHLVETVADAGLDVPRDPARVAVVTQTTLSVDDTARVMETLRRRFPALASPRREDICYATQNRQDAVRQLTQGCDAIVVVGSQSSSNSNRLREIATARGIPGYTWTVPATCVGNGSRAARWWASPPGFRAGGLVREVVARLCDRGEQVTELAGAPKTSCSLPLRSARSP